MASYDQVGLHHAVNDYLTGKYHTKRQSAIANSVPESTLRHHLLGRTPLENVDSERKRLTTREEEVLFKWVADQQRHLVALNIESVRNIVTVMLKAKGDFEPLGQH
jgi:hypothetical protein